MTDLGALPRGSYPFAINDAGQVTGWSGARVFLCEESIGVTDLGAVPGGRDDSVVFEEGNGINDAGQVVGWSSTSTGLRAFLWEEGVGLRALDDLIDPALGWSIFAAQAITGSGRSPAPTARTAASRRPCCRRRSGPTSPR